MMGSGASHRSNSSRDLDEMEDADPQDEDVPQDIRENAGENLKTTKQTSSDNEDEADNVTSNGDAKDNAVKDGSDDDDDGDKASAKGKSDVSEKMTARIQQVEETVAHVQGCGDFPCEVCRLEIKKINKLSQKGVINRRVLAELMASRTDFCKMFAATWRKQALADMVSDVNGEETQKAKLVYQFYHPLVFSCWNFTDKSDVFCLQMESDECFSLLVDWMISNSESGAANKWVREVIFNILNILHNACRRVQEIRANHRKIVPLLQTLGESEDSIIQTLAFLTLSYLVRKDEADKLSINDRCVTSLLTLLKKALNAKGHVTRKWRKNEGAGKTGMGFSALELIQGIEQLAINDNNKKLIAEKGGVELLAVMLQPKCSKEEQTHASRALWQLSFLRVNKDMVKEHPDIVKQLMQHTESEDTELRGAAMGALFEIFDSKPPEGMSGWKRKEDSKAAPEEDANRQEDGSGGGDNGVDRSRHIMISYKWENPSKPVMREIKNQLRTRGYKVWMDEDYMSGDKIGAMAEAVENAEVVLVCMSQGYQESQACRTEASYAYDCQRKIVPIKVHSHFTATGWLGGIMAGKIYYIVPEIDHVDSVLLEIIEKELGEAGRAGEVVKKSREQPEFAPAMPSPSARSAIKSWTPEEVTKWLETTPIGARCQGYKELTALSGIHLIQMKKQLVTAPQCFYQSMKDEMKIKYPDVLLIAAALEDLR